MSSSSFTLFALVEIFLTSLKNSNELKMTMELFGEEKISPHVAAYVGDLFLLESLVLTEVDANLRDKRNTTPLHHAIYGGFEDCASFLLEMGAEVDALDDRGITPLQIASYQGHLDCLKLLIRHGANVNLADTTMPKDSITTIAGDKNESEELLLTRMNESYNCSALHIACLQV
jgi:ankyrin repeat protein